MQNSQRLLSLDVFRGLTIACMILVNNPGSWAFIYPPLKHADWNGWTPTDLIFPFFIFIMGVSIKLSHDKALRSGKTKGFILLRILRRTVVLVFMGLILNGFPEYHISTIRFPGVLQRIAICYFVISIVYIMLVKTAGDRIYFSPKWMLYIGLGLLVLYYGLMQFVPVPGYGVAQWNFPEKNLSGYLDRIIFGENHLWSQSRTYDPEGLLSTLPALVTAITGVICAWWLKLQHQNQLHKLSMLFIAGVAGVLLGYCLNRIVPINKNLWTPSFVFLTSGMASLVLGICLWIVDIKSWIQWAKPFLVLGSNAILVYILSALVSEMTGSMRESLFQNVLKPVFGETFGSLVFAVMYVIFWIGLMAIFYLHRIFIKV